MPGSSVDRADRHLYILRELRSEFLQGVPYVEMLKRLNHELGPDKSIRARTFRNDIAALGWKRDRVVGPEDGPFLAELIHHIVQTGTL